LRQSPSLATNTKVSDTKLRGLQYSDPEDFLYKVYPVFLIVLLLFLSSLGCFAPVSKICEPLYPSLLLSCPCLHSPVPLALNCLALVPIPFCTSLCSFPFRLVVLPRLKTIKSRCHVNYSAVRISKSSGSCLYDLDITSPCPPYLVTSVLLTLWSELPNSQKTPNFGPLNLYLTFLFEISGQRQKVSAVQQTEANVQGPSTLLPRPAKFRTDPEPPNPEPRGKQLPLLHNTHGV